MYVEREGITERYFCHLKLQLLHWNLVCDNSRRPCVIFRSHSPSERAAIRFSRTMDDIMIVFTSFAFAVPLFAFLWNNNKSEAHLVNIPLWCESVHSSVLPFCFYHIYFYDCTTENKRKPSNDARCRSSLVNVVLSNHSFEILINKINDRIVFNMHK